jgi:hypothetical protein
MRRARPALSRQRKIDLSGESPWNRDPVGGGRRRHPTAEQRQQVRHWSRPACPGGRIPDRRDVARLGDDRAAPCRQPAT